MKLQVNTSGAWRNVCEFEAFRYPEVKRAIERIAPMTDADWCIVDGADRREWINGGRSAKKGRPHE